MKITIKHDTKTEKFYTVIGGKECTLKYEKVNENLYNLKMMFVPKNLRGQGVAGKIMEYALNYARKNMIKVKPSCGYIEDYIQKNLEHTSLLFKREAAIAEAQEL
jgi:predicted GNAT family acetyltransferase